MSVNDHLDAYEARLAHEAAELERKKADQALLLKLQAEKLAEVLQSVVEPRFVAASEVLRSRGYPVHEVVIFGDVPHGAVALLIGERGLCFFGLSEDLFHGVAGGEGFRR